MSICDSRFIVNTDEKDDHFIFTLPVTWNSRPYEYAWAKQFANPNDVVLDSASGIKSLILYFASLFSSISKTRL
ncbi:hypothetical protein P4V64_02030 [Bacillus thuringiensis]|nr:hypothetical protein [Bacillus thuringiensis]